ncbi:MAG: M13 family metallopeptidase [Ignavibacteria bacterium]|nr:M13 family metallopeptidase [Ignavibacteria bacterium]
MLKSRLLLLSVLSLLIVSGFSYAGDKKPETKGKGLDINNLNTAVSPADDFFEYATGGWVKSHPIPDDQTRWGSFNFLREQNNKSVRTILEDLYKQTDAKKGSAEQKIGDFYRTGMDSAKIEQEGYQPIVPVLKQIDELKDVKSLIRLTADMHLEGSGVFFAFFASIDSKASDKMAAHFYQNGLGLPDVEYYTADDERSKEIRTKYVQHVANVFTLIGYDAASATKAAEKVMAIEMQLAKASWTMVENRDPVKTYNKVSYAELKTLCAGFDWDVYFKQLQIPAPEYFVVMQPQFLAEVGKMMNSVSLDDWKIYLKWHTVKEASFALSSPFVAESFEFNSKFLSGQKIMRPRWRRVLDVINGNLGEMLGQIYVKKYFPPESKARAKAIVDNLLISMGDRIQQVPWMGEETKKAALVKLKKFNVKIGYPDAWKDFSDLNIENDSYYKNCSRASIWASKDNFSKIGKAVDKNEWEMSPQTVNAYYSPNRNEIVFPAAILQPPFFNPEADDAVNYGAMGAVIGHEISHGFDDQGRQYDANGNLTDWWTADDAKRFNERAEKLVEQFNNFVVIDTFKVNGALTLGENIGDLGGLTVALNAFKKTAQYKEAALIDGFTPMQRFFLSWGQVWAESQRPQAAKLQLKTDVHSPGKARVTCPLRNLPEFFDAFSIKPGSKMRNSEENIVRIW